MGAAPLCGTPSWRAGTSWYYTMGGARRLMPIASCAAIVLRLGARVPRPHRVIQLVLRPRAADALTLAPLTPAELSGMLVFAPAARRAARRVAAAAASSGGLPGDTSRPSWRCVHHTRAWPKPSHARTSCTTRERPSARRFRAHLSQRARLPHVSVSARSGRAQVWRAIGESQRLAGAGRHAAAERLLRAAAGAEVRRGREPEAGDAALACGRLHVDRGRTAAALASFSEPCRGTSGPGPARRWRSRPRGWAVRTSTRCKWMRVSRACVPPSPPAGLAGIGPRVHGRPSRWHARCGGLDGLTRPTPSCTASSHPMRKGTTTGPCQPRGSSRSRTRCSPCGSDVRWASPSGPAHRCPPPGPMRLRFGTPAAACLAELARAHWCATLGDVAGLDDSATGGLRLAREARRPLDALRFRALRCQTRAHAGSHAQAGPDERSPTAGAGPGPSGIAGGAGAPGAGRVRRAAAFEAARAGYCARGLGTAAAGPGPRQPHPPVINRGAS